MHVLKYLIYGVLLVVMFYTFIVLSNILASPFYDHITMKYERDHAPHRTGGEETTGVRGILITMKEEIKKAAFMLIIPLILMFIPVVGGVLGFLVAAVFVAWDYVDFSLARDYPRLRHRLSKLWHHKSLLVGFGFPLVIPFLGLIVLPFAILGSTLLYHEKMTANHGFKATP
jgi:CysZ protein